MCVTLLGVTITYLYSCSYSYFDSADACNNACNWQGVLLKSVGTCRKEEHPPAADTRVFVSCASFGPHVCHGTREPSLEKPKQ